MGISGMLLNYPSARFSSGLLAGIKKNLFPETRPDPKLATQPESADASDTGRENLVLDSEAIKLLLKLLFVGDISGVADEMLVGLKRGLSYMWFFPPKDYDDAVALLVAWEWDW
ncbi:hypothetical protein MMC30_005671 [Trapelia coarctata]|nr:hypothetical protein [Trapelia coarctata]